MSFYVPQSKHITWDRWASEFTGYNPTITNVPLPLSEDRWQEWAKMLQELPVLATYEVPYPQSFMRWQDWADRLLGALDGYN